MLRHRSIYLLNYELAQETLNKINPPQKTTNNNERFHFDSDFDSASETESTEIEFFCQSQPVLCVCFIGFIF